MPRVLKRGDLRLGLGAGFVFEQDLIIAVAIERRVQIDEVDGLVLDVIPQDVQIVAVVKGVHGKMLGKCSISIVLRANDRILQIRIARPPGTHADRGIHRR